MNITWIIPPRCEFGPMEKGHRTTECWILAELQAWDDDGKLIGNFCQRHGKQRIIEKWLEGGKSWPSSLEQP